MTKERKTLYERLTKRYLLIIHREENLKEEVTINFTFAKLIVFLAVVFGILLIFSTLVSEGIRAAVARKDDALTIDRQIVRLAMHVDSLEIALQQRDKYIEEVRTMINGGKPLVLEEPKQPATNQADKKSPTTVDTEMNPVDAAFRKEFEVGSENANVKYNKEDLKNMMFFPPLQGMVLKKYDYAKKHYGVDVVAQKNEPIKSAADGTVILSSWTQDSGYVIAVQHRSNLISFYKHNSVLLKKVGEDVRAGDIIAIIGNSGELTDGPHLHFELWNNGVPINPEDFIPF
jgi:murein DD-endopeptidase MepM/ murein hydrolase activator NlpD